MTRHVILKVDIMIVPTTPDLISSNVLYPSPLLHCALLSSLHLLHISVFDLARPCDRQVSLPGNRQADLPDSLPVDPLDHPVSRQGNRPVDLLDNPLVDLLDRQANPPGSQHVRNVTL